MKKKILIGSVIAAILMISVPLVSAYRSVPAPRRSVQAPAGDGIDCDSVICEGIKEGIDMLKQAGDLVDVGTPYGLDVLRDLRDAYMKYGKSLLEEGDVQEAISNLKEAAIIGIEIDGREDKEDEDSEKLFESIIGVPDGFAGSLDKINQWIVVMKELLEEWEKTETRGNLSAAFLNCELGRFYNEKSRLSVGSLELFIFLLNRSSLPF